MWKCEEGHNPIRTVGPEKGIHTCRGGFRTYTTFHSPLGLDCVEQFLESALEREEFGGLDSSR